MSEQKNIIMAMTGSVKQLKRKMSPVRDESNLLQNNNQELIHSYSQDRTVIRKRVQKMAKGVVDHFIGMVMGMSRSILKLCRLEVPKLKHFGEHLCLSWVKRLKRNPKDCIEVKEEE